MLPETGDGAGAAGDLIDPEVLFRAHPSLAQPSKPGYVHLTMASDKSAGRGRKRPGERNYAVGNNEQVSKKKQKTHMSSAERTALTTAELALVRAALIPHLGGGVQFDEVYRSIGTSGAGNEIKGVTASGTSDCPVLRERRPLVGSFKHRSNRMCFSMGIG